MTSWCLIKAACSSLYDLLLLRRWRLEWSNLNNSEIPFFYSQRVSLSPKIMPLCESHPRNIYFILHIVFQGEVNHCFEVFFYKIWQAFGALLFFITDWTTHISVYFQDFYLYIQVKTACSGMQDLFSVYLNWWLSSTCKLVKLLMIITSHHHEYSMRY